MADLKETIPLDKTVATAGGLLIRTEGYRIFVESPRPETPWFAHQARAMAAELIKAAEHVEGLKSPYVEVTFGGEKDKP